MARRHTPEHVQLLHGPYQAPALQRGDRATCLYRDADVVITSWTDAPISWPRCRLLDTHGGGSGLLVDDELARAVRCESALAIRYWWRVSHSAVHNWRKALGVMGSLATEGSRRLHRIVSKEGGAAVRRKFAALPPKVKRPRQRWPWTPTQDELVRSLPAPIAAQRTGRTLTAVYQRRFALARQASPPA